MTIFSDKQVKFYSLFLCFFILLMFLFAIRANDIQEKAVQHLLQSQDNAVVTSLLLQGVSKEVIAKAITSTASSEAGTDFLDRIGMTNQTTIKFLPHMASFRRLSHYLTLLMGILLSLVLLGGTYMFLWQREKLYLQAEKVMARFIEGDFSCHMPQMDEGAIYRVFASVEQLAVMLQSKNESSHKAKVFLKNTISDISHQLKTPLAALTLYHDIISDEPSQLETVKIYSHKTGLALKRMEQLIQSLLKITRLDAGSIIFEKECCKVSELISRAIDELATRAVHEGKEIVVAGSPEDTIICDRQWTREAIGNIVKNALDHTDSGDKIHIVWEQTPAMLRILISDNGAGIRPEDIHHIFKRFYRSKASLDTQGVGLGLSLAKSIIEGQGGVISVQSAWQEKTVFTLSFLTEV